MDTQIFDFWQMAKDPDPWLEQREEIPTTEEPLGQIRLIGFNFLEFASGDVWRKTKGYAQPIGEGVAETLRLLLDSDDIASVGLTRGRVTYSFEGFRVHRLAPDGDKYQVTVEAIYPLAMVGAKEWPEQVRQLKERKEQLQADQLYAYGVTPQRKRTARRFGR